MYLWVRLPDGLPSATFAERLLEDEGVASAAFAERLLEEEGVVVLPGSGFGAGGEGFFRVSFICSPERIAEAAGRAGRVLAGLAQAAA